MVPPNIVSSIPPWLILGFGFMAGWLKNFWDFLYGHTIGYLLKKIKVEITIEEQDHNEAFLWINLWMEKHLKHKKIVNLRLQKKFSYDDDEYSSGDGYELLPSYGFYWIWWNKKLLTFNSDKKDASSGTNKPSMFRRSISLTVWGTRDRNTLFDILLEAKKDFKKANPKQMRYYTHTSDWWDGNTLVERPLDTIYLPDFQLKDILKDFETFFASKEKYRNLGIPWRRGYLFEGPPGSGKSSFAQALSSNFKIPIYYLNIGADLKGPAIQGLLRSANGPCIVLIEDVDCVQAAKSREGETEKEEKGLQTSDLLNILDGLVASEQRIVIMTTNHPDKLDSALLRAGRVDRRFHIGFAKDEELLRFHSRASEYYSVPEFSIFRKSLPENCTLADAQNKVFESIQNT